MRLIATDALDQAAPRRRRKGCKLHPFLPAAMHRPRAIRWLKRFHAWFGVAGAAAGIVFAWSGFVLNHRTDFRIGGENAVHEFAIPAPDEAAFADGDAFGQYVRQQLDLFGQPKAPGMGGMGAAVPGGPPVENPVRFQALFRAASNQVAASYRAGEPTIAITRQERPPIRTLNRMHLGQAPNMGWQLVMDAFSGALIFLVVTGLLIWSRLSGPRLLALGLLCVSFSLTGYWMLIGP